MGKPRGRVIGFVGLGVMGSAMSGRLIELGHRLIVFDVSERRTENIAALGADAAVSPADVASRTDFVLTSLPHAEVVETVFLGRNGFSAVTSPNQIFADLSSSTPEVSKSLATALAAKDAHFLDAPVSRGARSARDGTLSMMVGGDPEIVNAGRPILEHLATDIIHVGPVGSGHAMKALNNHLSATSLIAACEALVLAAAARVDLTACFAAINVSSGGSHMTRVRFPRYYLPRNFDSNFSVQLMAKDCRIARSMASTNSMPLLLSSATSEVYALALAQEIKSEDNTRILEVVERLMNADPHQPTPGDDLY